MMRAMPVSRGLGLRSAPLTTHATTKKPTRHSFSVRAENKVVREYREGDDDVTVPGSAEDKPAGNPQSVYADELPPVPRSEMSAAMKEKLRKEYYGLGGSPNKAMGGNYFLYIILIISALAIMSAALGYLG